VAKKVYPERRMRYEHPFNIWRTLTRLKVMTKLQGSEDLYFSPSDIANVLYDNWQELEPSTQALVLSAKLHFPLRFLSREYYAIEETSGLPKFDYVTGQVEAPKHLDRWCVRPPLTESTKITLGDDYYASVHRIMDDRWGKWIGRKEFDYAKYMDKYVKCDNG